MNNKIWLVGVGNIGKVYAKVLDALGNDYIAIGRGHKSAELFSQEMGKTAIEGGLDTFLSTKPSLPKAAIVAVSVQQLAESVIALVEYGVKRILVEKPGFCCPSELDKVVETSQRNETEVFVAYNRRFYSSVLKAEEIIKEDGGLLSFNFEFTEWGHVIEKTGHPQEVLRNWMYANSSHVIDLAFFFGGIPREMTCYAKDELSWHKPINFAGAGITTKDILFNYQANWNAPGRWAVELLTSQHRLYLKPMETLQIQDKGSVQITPVEIEDSLDKEFKPGFYLQTKAFLEGDMSRLCTIKDQKKHVEAIYDKILERVQQFIP